MPSLPELLAAALPFSGLDDLLCRLAEWWQRACSADEVVISAAAALGDRLSAAHCCGGQPATISPVDSCGPDAPGPRQLLSSETSLDSVTQTIQLTVADASIGRISLVRPKRADLPPEWIAATASLLAHARTLELRLRDDKLSALAEFAAGAGHEINNPLAAILICAQRLQRETSDPEQLRLLATIGGQALRVRDMIGDVMLFARPPTPQMQSIDLSAAVADVLSRFADQCTARGIVVAVDGPSDVTVQADPTQLSVVVSELLRNAIAAQSGGGRIAITCRQPTPESSGCAVLCIADAGSGLDETTRRHLFDPFFSGRPAGRGLGFGLSKVWRIVGLHGGQVTISEPPDGGLALTVHWPIP